MTLRRGAMTTRGSGPGSLSNASDGPQVILRPPAFDARPPTIGLVGDRRGQRGSVGEPGSVLQRTSPGGLRPGSVERVQWFSEEVCEDVLRAVERNPELLVGDRTPTLKELRERVDKLSIDGMGFAHIVGLRQLIDFQGRTLSRKRLDKLLSEIWNQRESVSEKPSEVLAMYRGGSAPFRLPSRSSQYKNHIQKLYTSIEARPRGAVTNFQSDKKLDVSDKKAAALSNSFHFDVLRFERLCTVPIPDEGRSRISLHVDKYRAADLMAEFVRKVLDVPARYPSVYMAKIFGWNELGVRRDNIVIYLAESAIVKVLYWLAAYQRKDPKAFHPSTPKMMDQVMDGVAVASDVSEISFGEMRSRLIVDALKVAASTDKYPVFVRAVLANFRAAGIDPDAPHRHLPKSYVGDQRRHRTPASEPVDSAGSARQEAMSAHHSAQHPGDSTAVTDPLAGAGAELNWKKSAFSIADEKGDEACVSVIVVDPRLMKEGGDQAKAGRSASRVIGGQGPSYV